jgi:4-diphosphocytidyl-2-C-methyl-D-erythritol kinase
MSQIPLTALAPGKVNLCLFLGPARDDGRHELVTVFESVSLADELRMAPAAVDEVFCPGIRGPNLVASALTTLRQRGWDGPPVRIEIVKRIPVAAGMGGGSADAAAALRLAAGLRPISHDTAVEIATSLGADVPSQLEPGLVLGTGAGDVVERLEPLAPHAFVVVPLPAGLSTPAVYAEADRLGLGRSADELARLRGSWSDSIGVNDLEPAARSLCPQIDRALGALGACGAQHAFVAGSGPTCVGAWWGDGARAAAQEAARTLAGHFPRATAVVPVSGIGHNSPFR